MNKSADLMQAKKLVWIAKNLYANLAPQRRMRLKESVPNGDKHAHMMLDGISNGPDRVFSKKLTFSCKN